MDVNFYYFGRALRTGIIEEGEPYVRFTLTEAINLGVYPTDDGGSSTEDDEGDDKRRWHGITPVDVGGRNIRNYKQVNIKYIDIPRSELVLSENREEGPTDENKISEDNLNVSLFLFDKTSKTKLFIPSTNIASADVRREYPNNRFHRQQRYKEKGKTFIKVSGIILGFILAITQIVVNIVTIII